MLLNPWARTPGLGELRLVQVLGWRGKGVFRLLFHILDPWANEGAELNPKNNLEQPKCCSNLHYLECSLRDSSVGWE